MDSDLPAVILLVLLFATALNLFLILRLARIVLPPDEAEAPVPLVGGPAPSLAGSRLGSGKPAPAEQLAGCPLVLVFLSPGCPTCKSKIAELVEILPATKMAGISLWLIGADDRHDIASLTGGSPLAARTLALDTATREALNPLGAAPLYIFIDEMGTVRAGDYLGDENWRIFVEQMRGRARAGADSAEQEHSGGRTTESSDRI